jgi:ATP-binding cassette subfamily B protein
MKNKLESSLWGLWGIQIIEFFPYFVGGVICLVLTNYIQSFLPFLAKEMADLIFSGINKISMGQFFWLAIGIIIFRTSSRLLFFYPARVLQKDLRLEFLEKLERAFPARYSSYNSGQIFQRLNSDFEHVRAFLGFATLQIINVVISCSILLPKLIGFNPYLVIALIPMFILFAIFSTVIWKNRKLHRLIQDYQGEVQNFIMESYDAKKTIKNYHAEKSFVNLFKSRSLKELNCFYKVGKRIAVTKPLIPFGIGLSLLLGAYIIKMQNLGESSLILFSGFVFLFLEPLMFLSWIGIVFSNSIAAWDRIGEFVNDLEVESSIEQILLELNPVIKREQDLSFERMVVNFWDNPLEIQLKQGEWTVCYGRTGCGKSEMLLQIAEVLKLKGEEISFVTQAPYLYNGTIFENIFLGVTPSEEKIKLALKLLQQFELGSLASSILEVLHMEVGENGTKLSGGQAKRVCLIRSLLSECEYLIWDDPFSSVDLISERDIVDYLKQSSLLSQRYFLLSSHRLSLVRHCHYLYYLAEKIGTVEEGYSEDLLTSESKTYEYFKNQMA